MTRSDAIEILERVKHEHYQDYEGLHSCEGLSYDMNAKQSVLTGVCTCGAEEANKEIDAVIHWINGIGERRLPETPIEDS